MAAYYNENDPYAAQWLRNLIAAGHIAQGDVDERSIVDVRAGDLAGYRQCHFFAGIGIWSYALRLAGWPDDREVWTGSCPCQPFSAAGRGDGFDDGRHLWPDWSRLIGERRPRVVFGEQVADRSGLAWLDFVCADMEAAGYAIGALDTCSAGFGAPHIRQRLYFVADADVGAHRGLHPGWQDGDRAGEHSGIGGLADAGGERRQGPAARTRTLGRPGSLEDGIVGNSQERRQRVRRRAPGYAGRPAQPDDAGDLWDIGIWKPGPVNDFWRDAEWIPCIDGKARAVEPGTFPLAHGATARVGRLRAYGNAINARQAAWFVRAYLELTR